MRRRFNRAGLGDEAFLSIFHHPPFGYGQEFEPLVAWHNARPESLTPILAMDSTT
jgi:hypothetical protein